MKKIILLGFALLFFSAVYALPPLPTEYYGTAIYYNENVSSNQIVRAYYNNDTLCGTFRVEVKGYYGSLSCLGDDPETGTIEGGISSKNITFTIDNIGAEVIGDSLFSSGEFKWVNISAPKVYCGDGFCDAIFEACDICILDCGTCPDTNTTTNTTTNNTGGTTSGGTGGAGGTGGSGGAGDSTSVTGDVLGADNLPVCNPRWECAPWTDCTIENIQERTCNDLSACGTSDGKPEEKQACDYLAHCYNSVKDKDETGIDCGGSCLPCDHCLNGIKDTDEENVDCGGEECIPCASCFDGIRNQGEDGIDCGGPCDALCPEIIQRPGYQCVKSLSPYNTWFQVIIILVILSDVFAYLGFLLKSKNINENKKLDEFKKASKIYTLKRKVFIYIITTVVISALLLIYYWFFGVCEELNIKYLWILLILLFLSYFIISYLVNIFEFNEKKKLMTVSLLENKHYQVLERMLEFHKTKLNELVDEVNMMITILMKDKEFLYILETEPEFKQLYRDVIRIYLARAKTDAFSQKEEIEEIEELKKITEHTNFKKIVDEHPKIAAMVRKIELIVQQYDDLSKVEEEKEQMIEKVEGDSERERLEKENKEFNDKEDEKNSDKKKKEEGKKDD